jgi:hemerythrin
VALVQWKAQYSVNNPEIDAQHRRLFELINDLHASMSSGARGETVRVVEELVAYTRFHFRFEEELMERSGYEGVEAHKQVHRAMVGQVEKFRIEAGRTGASVSVQLMSFLKNWLSKHILETDMRYRGQLAS